MLWTVQTFRLASAPNDPALFCGKDQLALGGQPLLIQSEQGLSPRPLDQIQLVFDTAYGASANIDALSRLSGLEAVAHALGSGDMSRAALLSLMLRLPDIDPTGMSRLRKMSGDRVAKYDDSEPRDQQGRWTDGGASSPQKHIATAQKPSMPYSGRWPDRHRQNPNVVPVQGGAAGLPFPFPLPPVMPGNPLNPQTPKKPSYVFPPASTPETGADQSANDNARTEARASANDNAYACPNPSFEADWVDRTAAQLLYQTQISGLPPDMGVTLNGVKFDGCRQSDGTMLEAKTTGAWFAFMPDPVFRTLREYKETLDQAFRQISAAGSRKIEWHFSNPRAAEFWKREFSDLKFRITVRYTPYTPVAVKLFL